MPNQGLIWIVILFGIGVGLWSLVTPDQTEPKVKPTPQPFAPPPTCSADPPPICDPHEGGGWGNCNDGQGKCTLRRGCGTILQCSAPFTCTDALGSCIWY